jgi:hypothetical protein
MLAPIHVHAQTAIYKYKVYNIPQSQASFNSFYINEGNQIFLPLNGGIYLLKDSLWFISPVKGYYFTSFSPNLKDDALFVLANRSDSSQLFYLKSEKNKPIQRYTLAKFPIGIYNLVYKNGVCYVYGDDPNGSKIGILAKQNINWIFRIKDHIQQVQINESSEIFFALKNAIYQLSNQKKILILNSKINGFDFDSDGKIIVSLEDGIGIYSDGIVEIVASGIKGLIQYKNKSIYVLPTSGKALYQLYQGD